MPFLSTIPNQCLELLVSVIFSWVIIITFSSLMRHETVYISRLSNWVKGLVFCITRHYNNMIFSYFRTIKVWNAHRDEDVYKRQLSYKTKVIFPLNWFTNYFGYLLALNLLISWLFSYNLQLFVIDSYTFPRPKSVSYTHLYS